MGHLFLRVTGPLAWVAAAPLAGRTVFWLPTWG